MPVTSSKMWRYVHSLRLDTIEALDRQTDGQICHNNIALRFIACWRTIKLVSKKQKFPMWVCQIRNNVIFVLKSDARFYELRVHFLDLKQALQRRQRSLSCGPCVFCRCRTYCLRNPLRQSVRSSRSNTERDHCLSENYVRFSTTVTLYLLSLLLSEFCHH